MDDTKDEVQYKKDRGYWDIRYDFWSTAETLIVRRIRRTLGGHTLSLERVSDVHESLTSLLLTGDAAGSCPEDIAGLFRQHEVDHNNKQKFKQRRLETQVGKGIITYAYQTL